MIKYIDYSASEPGLLRKDFPIAEIKATTFPIGMRTVTQNIFVAVKRTPYMRIITFKQGD